MQYDIFDYASIMLWALLKSQAYYDQNYHITLKIMLAQLDQA